MEKKINDMGYDVDYSKLLKKIYDELDILGNTTKDEDTKHSISNLMGIIEKGEERIINAEEMDKKAFEDSDKTPISNTVKYPRIIKIEKDTMISSVKCYWYIDFSAKINDEDEMYEKLEKVCDYVKNNILEYEAEDVSPFIDENYGSETTHCSIDIRIENGSLTYSELEEFKKDVERSLDEVNYKSLFKKFGIDADYFEIMSEENDLEV